MTPERRARIQELFRAALQQEAGQCSEFLRQACAGDDTLRAEVERLLFERQRTGSMLGTLPEGIGSGRRPGKATPLFPEGEILAERFRIVRFLGQGGMGEVYEAEDLTLHERVALKAVRPDIAGDARALARFKQEIQLSRKISHPNVCRIFDVATHKLPETSDEGPSEMLLLTMELLEGETLAARLERPLRLTREEIASIGGQIAEALHAAHRVEIVHRDFKSANVMLVPQKGGGIRAVVTDFGLARRLAVEVDKSKAMTTLGHLMGTPAYMAPEQLEGREATPASDIYALGLVLYEMVTGQWPFPDLSPFAAAVRRIQQPAPSPKLVIPDVEPAWETAILRCLERDPERRFDSALDVARALRGETVATAPPSSAGVRTAVSASAIAPASAPGKRSRRSLLVAASVAGLLFIVFATVIFSGLWKRLLSGAGPAGIGQIVVLPSRVFAPESDGFLADAVPSLLSTHLSQIEGLDVKAPPNAVDFERVGGDLNKIVDAYKVDGLVLSTVTVQGDRLVLNLQLVEAASRRLIWSQEYAAGRPGYMELVRTAADGLRAAMRPRAGALRSASSGTTDTELLFQRGQYYARLYGYRKRSNDFDLALAAFQRLLEQPSSSSGAAAGIAGLYVSRIEAGAPLPETISNIDTWAKRALEGDPRSGEVWRVLSVAEEFRPQSDRRKRIEYALKAASLAPKSGRAQHALGTALAPNSFQLALAALNEASRLDPLQLNSNLAAGGALAILGRTSEGYRLIESVLKIEPDMVLARLVKVFVLLVDQRLDEAAALLKELQPQVAAGRLHPAWFGFAQDWLTFERGGKTGDTHSSEAALDRLVKQARGQANLFPQWQRLTLHVVLMLARHGKNDQALDILFARLDSGLVEPYDLLMQCRDLESLRRDTRFQNLAARSRVKFEELMVILQEARERGEWPAYLEQRLVELLTLPGLERRPG